MPTETNFINNFLLALLGQKTVPGSFFPVIMLIYDVFLKVYSTFFTARCEPQTMELKPGEFVIFTSATMHGSWPNVSDKGCDLLSPLVYRQFSSIS